MNNIEAAKAIGDLQIKLLERKCEDGLEMQAVGKIVSDLGAIRFNVLKMEAEKKDREKWSRIKSQAASTAS